MADSQLSQFSTAVKKTPFKPRLKVVMSKSFIHEPQKQQPLPFKKYSVPVQKDPTEYHSVSRARKTVGLFEDKSCAGKPSKLFNCNRPDLQQSDKATSFRPRGLGCNYTLTTEQDDEKSIASTMVFNVPIKTKQVPARSNEGYNRKTVNSVIYTPAQNQPAFKYARKTEPNTLTSNYSSVGAKKPVENDKQKLLEKIKQVQDQNRKLEQDVAAKVKTYTDWIQYYEGIIQTLNVEYSSHVRILQEIRRQSEYAARTTQR